MPSYEYADQNGHEEVITLTFSEYTQAGPVVCAKCGEEMQRQYDAPHVTWGGLKPSQGDLPVGVKDLLDTAPERRDAFEKEHEEHERRTATEDE